MKVFYWEGVSAIDAELLTQYEKQIQAILMGNYKEADLDTKKIPGHRLYTLRINKSDRLLCTTWVHNQQSHLFILEVIPNHDYQKSKYLNNPQLIKAFIDPLESEKSDLVVTQYIKSTTSPNELPTLEFKPLFYYHDFILLNDEQTTARQSQLPLIVTGPAGSGKSCVALSIITQQAQQMTSDTSYPILYVAKSANLVKRMKELWEQSPQYNSATPIVFMTYQEVIAATTNETLAFVDKNHFIQWLASNKKNKMLNVSEDTLYQELRICSSTETLEEYQQLGRKNSLLPENEKNTLFQLYQAYKQYLTAESVINLDFISPAVAPRYQRIVVDEAQDLSAFQLRLLWNAAINHQIAYCLDTHQSICDAKSILPYLKSLFYPHPVNHIKLPSTYRCSPNVLQLANRIITLKNSLAHGIADKEELTEIKMPSPEAMTTSAGATYWLDTTQQALIENIKSHYKETEIAIVTDNAYLHEAKDQFDTPLIFTPAQIKGLEYRLIIAYRPLENDTLKSANKYCGQQSFQKKTARPKHGNENYQFNTAFNQLFTTVTRAMESCVLVHKKTQENDFARLKQALSVDIHPAPIEPCKNTATTTVSDTEWLMQAEKLLLSDNEIQAEAIFLNKLHKTKADFLHFKNAHAMPVMKKPEETPFVFTKKYKMCADKLGRNFTKKNLLAIFEKFNEEKVSAVLDYLHTKNSLSPVKVRELLETLVDYPEHSNKINYAWLARILCQPFPENNDSPLCVLLRVYSKELMSEIKPFMSHALLEQIQPEDFYRPNTFDNTSIFYWLLDGEFSETLLWLFENNPRLWQAMQREDICRSRINVPEEEDNLTILFLLAREYLSEKPQTILKILFEKRPDLIKQISGKALCHSIVDKKNLLLVVSPIFVLTSSEKGLKLLKTWFELYPDILSDISGTELCRPLPSDAEEDADTSAFYWLTNSRASREILYFMLSRNPNIAKTIQKDDLYRKGNGIIEELATGYGTETSAMDFLTHTQDGKAILQLLKEQNPTLFEIESPKPLTISPRLQQYTENLAKVFTKKNLIAAFQKFDEGKMSAVLAYLDTQKKLDSLKIQTLLEAINENPQYHDRINADVLIQAMQEIPRISLFLLAKEFLQHKNSILERIFEKKPDLLKKVLAQDLCQPFFEKNDTSKVLLPSPLYILSYSPAGCLFLKKWFTLHPEILQNIEGRALCLATSKDRKDNANTSAFYWLTASTEGQAVLLLMLQQNPSIAKSIQAEDLQRKANGKSPLDLLSKTKDGLAILQLLEKQNPELSDTIQMYCFSDFLTPSRNSLFSPRVQIVNRDTPLSSTVPTPGSHN